MKNFSVKKYENNIYEFRAIIYKDNRNKSGIYKWTNKINNKTYIGSSRNLSKRLATYFSLKSIQNIINQKKSKILSAIIEHSYSNFSLEILEYCDEKNLLEREQYYIDHIKPEYNILKIAGSRLGYRPRYDPK